MLDPMWESAAEAFGLQHREDRDYLWIRVGCLLKLLLRFQITRTRAIFEEIVGLDFDGGHHVVERRQVRRRKQHPEEKNEKMLSHFHLNESSARI